MPEQVVDGAAEISDEIAVGREGQCVTIRINRTDKRNALTFAMYSAAARALEDANADQDVRVVVLTGTGGSFTAGNDLGDFLSGDRTEGTGEQAPVRRFQEAVLNSRAVLIAAVDGPAVGIGATVLLHCDLVYATRRSYLLFPFIDLGLVPEFASSLLLPRLIGPARAAEILLFGERLPAETANQLGLVTTVLPDADALTEHVAERVAALLAKPARALAEVRALLRTRGAEESLARMGLESAAFRAMLRDPDTKARIAAVLAGRR
ncbi:MAG TPA: enoyl-CoA hydratase-related protein [Pseudonocardiaceae bacterium]|jgi:enoyl-CoA hydratase/carnithine racemase|nr:enoyl-CoA hydratase-related protein [Pseudonocardiaceae bacterium]